jgi:hypothetical protein
MFLCFWFQNIRDLASVLGFPVLEDEVIQGTDYIQSEHVNFLCLSYLIM